MTNDWTDIVAFEERRRLVLSSAPIVVGPSWIRISSVSTGILTDAPAALSRRNVISLSGGLISERAFSTSTRLYLNESSAELMACKNGILTSPVINPMSKSQLHMYAGFDGGFPRRRWEW